MSSETNEQFLSDNSALEGASFFFGLRSSPEQEQNEYTVLNSWQFPHFQWQIIPL